MAFRVTAATHRRFYGPRPITWRTVALRSGPPPDGFYRRLGGREDQERASQGEQVKCGRDEEASLRGRCSGGCRRPRRSGLNKLAYDIINEISWSSS
jgi:hypothetical protein